MAALNPFQVTKPKLPTTDPTSANPPTPRGSPFDQTAAMMGAGGYPYAPSPPTDQWSWPTSQQMGPAVGQPLQAPGGTNMTTGGVPDWVSALFGIIPGVSGAQTAFNGVPGAPQAAGMAKGVLGGTGGNIGNAFQSVANGIHNTVGQIPNPLNGGQPFAGPPVGPGSGVQPTPGTGPAGMGTGTPTANQDAGKTGGYTPGSQGAPNTATGGPAGGSGYGFGTYFNPDANNPDRAYQNIMLSRGFNPLAGPVGRYAAQDFQRQEMNYLANQIMGGAPLGQTYDQAFNSSFSNGGAAVSNPQAVLQAVQALRQKMIDVSEGRAQWSDPGEAQRAQMASQLFDNPQALSSLIASQAPRGLGGMSGMSSFMQNVGGLASNAGSEPVDFITAMGRMMGSPSGGSGLNGLFGGR